MVSMVNMGYAPPLLNNANIRYKLSCAGLYYALNISDLCSSSFQLIQDCWQPNPEHRPSFDLIKKTIHKINPSKLSPVDLMMAMVI